MVVDPQDPLPESNWLWRRIFIFSVSAVIIYLLYGTVDRLGKIALLTPATGVPAFVAVVKLLILTLNAVILYYMVAPSAEQITKLVKTASLLRSGVQFASRAVAVTPDSRQEQAATAGLPPQPVIPDAGEPIEASELSAPTASPNEAPVASTEVASDEKDTAPRSKADG